MILKNQMEQEKRSDFEEKTEWEICRELAKSELDYEITEWTALVKGFSLGKEDKPSREKTE